MPVTFLHFPSHSIFFESLSSLSGGLFFFLIPITLTAHYNSRGDRLIPGHLISLSISPCTHPFIFLSLAFAFHATFCKSVSSLHPSHCSLLSVFHRNEHPLMHTRACTCVKYMKTTILISPSPSLSFFLSLSILHTLSCNSILIGFIGLAIHLSAATKFNYIRKPFGLSPDNQQHFPPRHRHSHAHASLRIHIKKKKKSNFYLTMVAQR